MRSLHFWARASRWHMCLAAAVGTWVVSLLSDGPEFFTTTKIMAAMCMAMGVAGSSLYHYGAAYDVYTRKSERLWIDATPRHWFIGLGVMVLMLSTVTAMLLFNVWGVTIMVVDSLIILLYARFLGRHWITKNALIAFVATTPGLLGWVVGHRMNAAVPWILVALGAAYWAREIVKDIEDIHANYGRRVTLPMVITVRGAMRIAAILLGASVLALLIGWQRLPKHSPLVVALYALAIFILGRLMWRLLREPVPGNVQKWIFRTSLLLTAAMLFYRLSLS